MKKVFSGIMLTLLLTGLLVLAFNVQPVKASYTTIYIRPNGDVDPPTAPIQRNGDIYTLTGNISSDGEGIIIQKNNVVIDGAGYTIQGPGTGYLYEGVVLSGRNNVTLENTRITNFFFGIHLEGEPANSSDTSNNHILGNNITDNEYGIALEWSSNSSIVGNVFVNDGLAILSSYGNVVSGNLVNGKPLVYLEDVSDCVVEDAGQVVLENCNNITVVNSNLSHTTVGIELWNTGNTRISGNNITANNVDGIDDWGFTGNNSVSGNNITGNNGVGILLRGSPNSSISGNTINANGNIGIEVASSSSCTVSANNVTNSPSGIILWESSNCTVSGNNIANNSYEGGIYLYESSNNRIYHNNFVNNTGQVHSESSTSIWDDGYPSGGNYWSDYTGVDLYSGPYQNITGSDGIGDTPYIIDSKNKDRYPFMGRNGWWNNTELDFSLTPSPAYVGQTVTMLGNLTDRLGNPINNTKIDVYVNGTFTGSLFTNSSGWFTASAKVDTPGTYVIKVVYSGSATYKPSNHIETLEVYPKVDTKVSFTLSPNPAKVGQTITMLGNLTDINNNPIGNAPLELYTKKGTGSWQYAGTISTNSSGWFKAAGKITSTGTYQVAVLYRGSYKHNQSYHIETLTVNPSMVSEIASNEAHWLKTG